MIQEQKLNLDSVAYKKNYAKEILTSKNREIDSHNSIELRRRSIIEDMQWFYFHGIMLHTEDNIKRPAELLQSLLK